MDLKAANKKGITVAEVTGSNTVSVAEHTVMTILALVGNFVPAHEMIQRGEWNVARAAADEYDLEGKTVGIAAAGRIGRLVMERLKPFGLKEVLYFDYQALSKEQEEQLGCRQVESLKETVAQSDVVDIHCPLLESTYHLFDEKLISKMKRGIVFPILLLTM